MRIAILGLNYAPEPVGIGPYTHGLAQALAAAGWEVDVVTAQPYYPAWRRDPAFARPWWRREQVGGIGVTRCPLFVPSRPTGARRILHHLSFALAAIPPMLAAAWRRPDVVLTIAPSLFSVPVAALAARLAGAPLWIHVQDFEVEAALATGLVAPGRLARAALRVETRLLAGAALVSTISPQMVARLLKKGVQGGRVRELRNWASTEFKPTPGGVERLRAQWELRDRQVALYSGNIAAKQGVALLIEAARRLADRPDIVLVICGDGAHRDELAALATGLPNVQLHPLQPAARMGDLLALAAMHLLPQLPGTADLVLPSKLTNMLASGRPVIATAAPGTGLYQEVEGCGIVTPPGDAGALADAVRALADDRVGAAALGRKAMARAAERWSAAAILPRFIAAAAAVTQLRHLPDVGMTAPVTDASGPAGQGERVSTK